MNPPEAPIPIFSTSVSCGFPSPAEESIEQMASLDELAINAPAATFLVRAGGDSMIGAGIYPDDIIVVDRSITAKDGDIVLAVLNGEFLCKSISITKKSVTLIPENSNYPPINIDDGQGFYVWGVCTFNLHRLHRLRRNSSR